MTADKRPVGRPPISRSEPSVSLHVRLPASQYDRLVREAQSARRDFPAFVRERLFRVNKSTSGDNGRNVVITSVADVPSGLRPAPARQ